MRDFIKENLRILLEGIKTRDTSRNTGSTGTKSLVRLSKSEMKAEVEQAQKIYKKYPKFFGGAEYGEALIEFMLYIRNGELVLKPKANSVGIKRIAGIPSPIENGKQYYYMSANLPKDEDIINDLKKFMSDKVGKSSKDYIISRVDVAYLKTLVLNYKEIMEFNGENSYTADDQLSANEKASTEKTPEDRTYLKNKFIDAERRKQNKGIVSIDGPDYTKNPAYIRLSTQLKNKLELSKKLDNPVLTQDIATLKAEIEKIKANHAE